MQSEDITKYWWGKHIDNPGKIDDKFVAKLAGAWPPPVVEARVPARSPQRGLLACSQVFHSEIA
jgi:hypothetical protein